MRPFPGCSFHIKNLNVNWKILTKNLISFKRWNAVKVHWGFTEKSDFLKKDEEGRGSRKAI